MEWHRSIGISGRFTFVGDAKVIEITPGGVTLVEWDGGREGESFLTLAEALESVSLYAQAAKEVRAAKR